MDGLAAAAGIAILAFFVLPVVVCGAIGAASWRASRLRGALVGVLAGLVIGYAAFQFTMMRGEAVQQPEATAGPATAPTAPVN